MKHESHWFGCTRTDHDHYLIRIHFNNAGNIAIKVENHLWPTKKYGWIACFMSHWRWSSRGNDRVAYRKARDRARKLSKQLNAEIVDGVRCSFFRVVA